MRNAQKRNKKLKKSNNLQRTDRKESASVKDSKIDPGEQNPANSDINLIVKLSQVFLDFIEEVNTQIPSQRIIKSKSKALERLKKTIEKKIEKTRGRAPKILSEATIPEKLNLPRKELSELKAVVDESRKPSSPELNYDKWDINKLVEHLQYCHDNSLLASDQIQLLSEWMAHQTNESNIGNMEYRPDDEFIEPSEPNVFPTNCMHVSISYYIWDRQNNGVNDPTELGRKYKEFCMSVS
jgi:hypothetical protein